MSRTCGICWGSFLPPIGDMTCLYHTEALVPAFNLNQ
ncbi:MAG: hypothetical protein H6R46_1091 [Proteobacteria bacterium]|nr:hypothetical protein [Pseudomonadota bacterium]